MSEIEFKTGVIKPIECLKEGWELIKDQYWLSFGITFVGMFLAGVIPFGIALGAMFCGIYYCMLRKMNGKPMEFADLFKGFNYFLPGLTATLVLIIPSFILGIVSAIPLIMMQIRISTSPNPDPNEIFAYFGFFMVEMLILWLILGCIHAFLFFAYPLIVEYNLTGLDAFKLSAKAVWKNLGGVVGFITAELVLGIIGYLVCFVGLYFTLPIMFAGALVAYRKVFPAPSARDFNPPSPQFYEGI